MNPGWIVETDEHMLLSVTHTLGRLLSGIRRSLGERGIIGHMN
jgi:hypothetical protein